MMYLRTYLNRWVVIPSHFTLLVIAAIFFWWLAGYDVRVTGENRFQDYRRRTVRSLITLGLIQIAWINAWAWRETSNRINGLMFVAAMMPLAFIWAGCLSELLTRWFCSLIDFGDNQKSGSQTDAPNLDEVASLIRSGRKREAIQLCQKLRKSGDAGVLIVETMLAHLGVQEPNRRPSKPLVEAGHLGTQGKFKQAAALLNSLLAKEPANADAAFMLVRIYAKDLRRPRRARRAFRHFLSHSNLSTALIDYMDSSIHDWSRATPPTEACSSAPAPDVQSIDEMLAQGRFGTVVDILEQKLMQQPGNFDLWMKYAETHGRYCSNFQRAEKIVQKIEANPGFSAEQMELARTTLSQWRQH